MRAVAANSSNMKLCCSTQRNDEDRMRTLGENSGGTEPAKAELPEKQPAKPRSLKGIFRKPKMKLPSFKSLKSPKNSSKITTQVLPPREVVLTFEENLRHWHLSQAGQQLIQLEENLFGRDTLKEEKERREEEEKLRGDYEALLNKTWQAVEASLSAGSEELEVLRSAVRCVQQEEKQDRRWQENPVAAVPAWRPRQCRQTHDAQLLKVVEKRMDEMEDVSGADNLSSSLKRDICKMGIRLKEDLLKVARDLKSCYPEDFDICNVYARLYHKAFAECLMKIAEFELDLDDCIYLLSWVNNHYPNAILKNTELKETIECQSLGALLPVEVTRPLEQQYLSHIEANVENCISNALRKEEKSWLSGSLPELSDGHYANYIAIDVIQCIDGVVKDATTVLGETYKAQSIMGQLKSFLTSYKRSLEEFMKGKRGNIKAVIKANLASLKQFQDYIEKGNDFFTEEMRISCLSIVKNMKDCGYLYLSNIIHEDLKVQYRKLGTQAWLTGKNLVLDELLEGISGHIERCRDLKTSCFEELLGRLHTEVMVEYVKRLLKKKLKLKDKVQQEAAAMLLCEDSKKMHTMFTEEGSNEEWLSDILPKIAEMLKMQDPSIIQLEIVTLARDYPDLSERQVSELLHLKANLSTPDIKKIKESLMENRHSVISQSTKTFFSRIEIKWRII